MTARELRDYLYGLPDDMPVIMRGHRNVWQPTYQDVSVEAVKVYKSLGGFGQFLGPKNRRRNKISAVLIK